MIHAAINKPTEVISDPGVKAAGLLQKALDALAGVDCAVFDQTPSNPTEAAVRADGRRDRPQPTVQAERSGSPLTRLIGGMGYRLQADTFACGGT